MQIPKNVVQAGEVDPCHKIYIEDYVHTFLTQYRADSADFCLYGKSAQEEGISYYFIYGAVKEETGWEMMKNRYFSGSGSIGEASCDKEEIWLFFEDGYAAALDGYFIFYEQNEDMQSYLIAMHQNQPGEKTVEVRPRASSRLEGTRRPGTGGMREGQEGRMESRQPGGIRRGEAGMGGARERMTHGTEPSGNKDGRAEPGPEPRRIRRIPWTYDLKQEEGDREKVMHAAQMRSGRKGGKDPVSFTGRAASLGLMLVLCGIGIVSINRYQDMQEVGNFFAQTARGLMEGGEKQEEDPGSLSGEGDGFVVEERKLSLAEATTADQAFPTFVPAQDASEHDGDGTEDGTRPQDTEGTAAVPEGTGTPEGTEVTEETVTPEEMALPEEGTAAGASDGSGEAEDADREGVSAEPVSASGTVSYTVQKGDSIAIICRRQYGNTDRVQEVISLNDLPDPDHLVPGQKILLPN